MEVSDHARVVPDRDLAISGLHFEDLALLHMAKAGPMHSLFNYYYGVGTKENKKDGEMVASAGPPTGKKKLPNGVIGGINPNPNPKPKRNPNPNPCCSHTRTRGSNRSRERWWLGGP